MSALRRCPLPLFAATAVCGLVGWTAFRPLADSPAANVDPSSQAPERVAAVWATVDRVNRMFDERWAAEGLAAAEPADDLQVLRRLSLALFGTIPSLEEIRRFEAEPGPDQLERWTRRMLADPRFGANFGERLGVVLLGEGQNDHPQYRRERFVGWLGDELQRGRPYDEIARRIIAETGPATSAAATNFVTAQLTQDDQFANRLASRSVRAFLGQRIDCAECHDHPFERWTQADFEGLAAYFGQVRFATSGVEDDADRRYEVEDRSTLERREVPPCVPFNPEWAGESGSRREQLAAWITHRDNRRFSRAIVNRVWGLMFGRPFVTPVDDIPDPPEQPESDETALLDVLVADLQTHDYDLRRTVLVIALSRPFRLASTRPPTGVPDGDASGDAVATDAQTGVADCAWDLFPLVQLRPEQLSQAMLQVTSIQPLDNMNIIARSLRLRRQVRFLDEHGRLGENEFDMRTTGIPQIVTQMGSRYTRQSTEAGAMSASGRIAALSRDDDECLEACFLVCLTRRPTGEEREYFLPQLDQAGRGRARAVEDIFWSLLNSPEFLWNH